MFHLLPEFQADSTATAFGPAREFWGNAVEDKTARRL
jgi:hypothetical protein